MGDPLGPISGSLSTFALPFSGSPDRLESLCGFGGVFSIRRTVSKNFGSADGLGDLGMKKPWPKEIIEPLYTSIGSLVVNWSLVESALDACIAIIFQSAGGKHLGDGIPRMLKRKTKFLKKCFNKIEGLKPFEDDGRALLARISALAETRHFIAHGYISDYRENEGHSLLFVKIDAQETIHVSTKRWFPAHEILDAGNASIKLASDLLAFANRLIQKFTP